MRQIGRTAAVGNGDDGQDDDSAAERQRQHVAGPYRLAGAVDLLSIDPDMTGNRKPLCRRAGARKARMPEPFVDALAGLGS